MSDTSLTDKVYDKVDKVIIKKLKDIEEYLNKHGSGNEVIAFGRAIREIEDLRYRINATRRKNYDNI